MSEWRVPALQAIRELAEKGEPFTSDEVHAAVGDPPEYNEMGAVFREAENLGIIERTEGGKRSTRKEAKGRRLQLWKKKTSTGSLFLRKARRLMTRSSR